MANDDKINMLIRQNFKNRIILLCVQVVTAYFSNKQLLHLLFDQSRARRLTLNVRQLDRLSVYSLSMMNNTESMAKPKVRLWFKRSHAQQAQTIFITIAQRRPNVFDVYPASYKCYTNVLCLLGGFLHHQDVT